MRDNIHSEDLVRCFGNCKNQKIEIYNAGGGRYSNCSIIEALNRVEYTTNIKIKKKVLTENRVGDHVWYVTNMKKFKKHYPNWKQKYSTVSIIDELIDVFKK